MEVVEAENTKEVGEKDKDGKKAQKTVIRAFGAIDIGE